MHIENHCVSCDIPCNPNCNLTHVKVYTCDCCGEEINERGYRLHGMDLCAWCAKADLIDNHYMTREAKIRFFRNGEIDDEVFLAELDNMKGNGLFNEMMHEDIEVIANDCGERLEALE